MIAPSPRNWAFWPFWFTTERHLSGLEGRVGVFAADCQAGITYKWSSARCFVHITNSLAWRAVTGEEPPTTPLTSREYQDAGLPWFDWYGGDREALEGAKKLADLKTVKAMGEEKGEHPLPENELVKDPVVITLGGAGEGRPLREGGF